MRAVYKKRLAESRITGENIVQEIPLDIHYEATSLLTVSGEKILIQCEPHELGRIYNADNVVYLNGLPADLKTLKLLIVEVEDKPETKLFDQ